MVIRHKYNKDQKLLGAYVDGMPEPVIVEKPSKYDNENVPSKPDYFVERKEMDGQYAYNDLINMALPVVCGITGTRVLVCPKCKKDVEPVMPKPHKSEGDVLFEDKSFDKVASFAFCNHCLVTYLLPELVVQKSFRLTMPSEDLSKYYPYLTLEYFKGNWCVLQADLMS